MVSRISMLLATTLLAATAARCFSQELDDHSASALTREQWQQRLEQARQRSEEFVAKARARTTAAEGFDQKDAEASERAMNDPTLQRGDIVATDKGLLLFIGKDEERRPGDFRLAPNSVSRP